MAETRAAAGPATTTWAAANDAGPRAASSGPKEHFPADLDDEIPF